MFILFKIKSRDLTSMSPSTRLNILIQFPHIKRNLITHKSTYY